MKAYRLSVLISLFFMASGGASAQTPGGTNVALSSNGGVATASSTTSEAEGGGTYPPSGAINGDRRGAGWSINGGWRDGTNTFPDWLQVTFQGSRLISEIDVFTLQDNYQNPSEPTEAMTFAYYGITSFEVQYLRANGWVTVPGGYVTGNNRVWRKFTFPAVTATGVRVLVHGALGGRSRIVELEAWTVSGPQVTNLAAGKPASQSTTYQAGTEAAKAVDGDVFSITHTQHESQAWWQVDLGASSQIEQIKVWNRTDCCGERLSNFYVLVSDQPITSLGQAGVWNNYVAGQAGWPSTIPVGRTGRYVRIQLSGSNWLSLAEVEVLGTPAPGGDPNNVALASSGATAVASSTYSGGYGPHHAIDGRRSGHQWSVNGGWNDATPGSWPDWLEVRFNGAKLIDRVNVFSVQDNYMNPVEPTEGQTFSLYGLVNFDVEYWTGVSWTPVPNGEIAGNNLVRREINFSPVQTDKIRVVVTNALNSWTRITEVEAFQPEFSTLAAQKGCNLSPAKLAEEILAAIQNEGQAETGTLYREKLPGDPANGPFTGRGRWRRCLNPPFSNWKKNGSQNLPVLAAAIGLFRENSVSSPNPNVGMSNPNDLSRNAKSYALWWAQFLQYQVGARDPALDGHDFDALRHFKGTELFSNIYDAHTVTAIISARFWAAKNGSHQHAVAIRDHALRYLRANWLIYGLSAGTGPATSYASPNSEGISRPPNEPLRPDGQPKYNGHFLAMAGSRSNSVTWDEGARAALFDRAIQYANGESPDSNTWRYGVAPKNEYSHQVSLLNYMNERWPTADSGPKNLYGLEQSDWLAFRDLIHNGQTSYFNITDWLRGIKTVKTMRVVGWSSNGQHRLSTLAGNPNGNNPAIFAVKYEQSNSRATFLYPYTDNRSKGANHKMGGCEILTGMVRANNGGPHTIRKKDPATGEITWVVVHPFMTAEMTIPTQDAKFHLVLSHSADARWEAVLPKSFPPPEPHDPSPHDPEGEDPYPPEN